jgi:histidine transport system permease protein
MVLAVTLGLIGASAKLSKQRLLRHLAAGYTTLIRSVPDLVIMLLLFFSLQIWLNNLTEWLNSSKLISTSGCRGVHPWLHLWCLFHRDLPRRFQSVPAGQLEAAIAYGMNPRQVFVRVLFPQMMRFALPGIGNNWQVLIKATALVSIIGLIDIVKVTQDAGKHSMQLFFFSVVGALIYLAITTLSNGVLIWLERRYSVGVRGAQL